MPPQRKSPDVQAAWRAEGVPVLSGGDVTTPFELLCGSRSLVEFSMDLMEIPDKVVAAMKVITPHLAGDAIATAKKQGYPLVWIGGWRKALQLKKRPLRPNWYTVGEPHLGQV